MTGSISRVRVYASVIACLGFLLGPAVRSVLAQASSVGTVNVTVLDPSAKVIPGAPLQLVNVGTGASWQGKTTGSGTYSFVGVPVGTYELTTTKPGFQTEVNKSVIVQAGQVTSLDVPLKVGTAAQTVTVTASATPLLQTTNNSVATTISMKQLQDLPLSGRSVVSLAYLVPGYAGGTWNGMPVIDQTTNIDGVISSSSRMKFSGNLGPGGEGGMQARLDSISQMTVTTSQMGVSQGYGQSSMEQTYVTSSGTNSLHGNVYEDFRNSYLNANTWTNDATNSIRGKTVFPTPRLILNDFGGSVGGRIIRDKLFFFGSFQMSKQPGGSNASATVMTAAAQAGNLIESNGNHVCLLQVSSFCPAQAMSVADQFGLRDQVNGAIAPELSAITSAESAGVLTPINGEANLQTLTWFVNRPQTFYFPTARADYILSSKVKMDLAWNGTKFNQPNAAAPYFPGSAFANQAASNRYNDYTASLGIDWTITPTLVNQFRGGYFYNSFWNTYGGTTAYNQSGTVPGDAIVGWAFGSTPQTYHLPVTEYFPIVNFSDGLTWQKSAHTASFGVTFWREQDHYWNPPDGILSYTLGLPSQSAQLNDFSTYFAGAASQDRSDAENLYATLTGVVSRVHPSGSGFPYDIKTGTYTTPNVGEYPLDELVKSWGLYFSDSWRMKPSFTLTYGMRWDFLGPDHDLTGAYHSVDKPNTYGPTLPSQIFQTGSLGGVQNPVVAAKVNSYNGYYLTPQPQLGFAWNPRSTSGLLGKLMGNGDTVIRASVNIRRFTEPQQYVWNAATNLGFAYYQNFTDAAVPPLQYNGTQGTFPAGQLYLGLTPAQLYAQYPFARFPLTYQNVYQQSDLTYVSGNMEGINYNIKQPYMEEWNFGIQRQFGHSNVLSLNYIGHHALHEWVVQDPSEVNMFQNNGYPSFLSNFQAAQHNLAVNAANGKKNNFADLGFNGDQPLPVFEAAFANEELSPYTAADYHSGSFLTELREGAAGALASTLAHTAGYFCSMVGAAAFSPCGREGLNYAGSGFPINYFQSNPYMDGYSGYTDSAGFGNYNGLQVDLRQNEWHGMQFDANYTWAHSLGIEPNSQWEGFAQNFYTIRDSRLNYGPATFDIRQVVHVSGTYDLPFGAGKRFANSSNPVLDRVVGGWTVGTILNFQTGTPTLISGGYATFNDISGGGVALNGVSLSTLQSDIGVYPIHGPSTTALGIAPGTFTHASSNGISYISYSGGAGSITPNISPGSFEGFPYVHGPHFLNTDLAVTKFTRIHENIGLIFQGEFLNAFNHPNWGLYGSSVSSNPFLGASVNSGPRSIQLRASITF